MTTKGQVTLSKTNYILYRDCPKNTWLKIHKPDIYFKSELSEFEKSIIETGNEVELVARQLFPTGVLIEGRDEDAQKLTADYIDQKQPTLFQAVFDIDNFLAASDILKYDSQTNSYSIYEIKASNSVDDKVHIHDLAFQVNVLRRVGLVVNKATVIHLNSEYKRDGELEITRLFEFTDVTEQVENIVEEVLGEMNFALKYLSTEIEPVGHCSCLRKGRSKHCTTFHYSNPQVPDYSVHDIARIGLSKVKLTELVDSNIFHIKDVPREFELSETQRNQIDSYIFDRVIIDHDKIREEFEDLIFPLYFLDYETFPAAIPRFNGFSPYQQIPFQYSLHVVNKPESEPRHFEFLYTENGDPSKDFVDSMQRHIGNVGSIIVWHKSFECNRNKELAERIPEAKGFMNDINNRTYDLEDIFKKQYHVHKDYKGSSSIKKVLPVLAPDLSYKNLEIQEGGSATQAWNKIVTSELEPFERDTIIENLKNYCKLDTYAMYAIWRELYKLIND
ncbi:MAG: DUF2779 domain-containing protein [Minisyncoccia bacterium]